MPRTELLEQNATRVELDHRSRDARLRLEQVERLLVVRPLPRQSLLRRVLRCLGSRTLVGEQIEGRSVNPSPAGARARGEHEMPAETGGASGVFLAAPPASWPNCSGGARISPGSSDPVLTPRVLLPYGFKAWDHWCGRGDSNFHSGSR